MIATLAAVVILLIGLVRRVDGYAAFTEGAREGLKTAVHIAPTLCAALLMTAALRGSGLLDAAEAVLRPALGWLGIPAELLPFMLLRPVSGSGALSALGELMAQYGADSDIARMAAAMMGSSETVLYVVPVYLGAAGMKKARYVLPAALLSMAVGMTVAIRFVGW